MKDQGEGLGKARRTPRPAKGGRFGWWGRPQPAVQFSESFGQASAESLSQGHLLKCTRDPPASVPLPGLLTGWKQQGRHDSCEQCRNGSRGTELGSAAPPAAGGLNSGGPAHHSWSLKPGAGRMVRAGTAQGFWLHWRLPTSGSDPWPLQPRASLPAPNWGFCCCWLPDGLCLLPHWQPSSSCV